MTFKVFNTLSREKEEFKPLKGKDVRYYTCGPTVYWFQHIGNMRAYTVEDLFKRYLLFKGFKPFHVMNVTDVGHLTSDEDSGEDKMEKAAKTENKTVWELAEYYTNFFQEQLSLLNILKPSVLCKATDHINEQIEWIKRLEAKGYTYVIDDGVYFDTSKFESYGALARLDLEGLREGARVEKTQGKKNASDFALWKFSKEDRQMEWDSPWGKGFPGWHIECSAMAVKYLGETLDVHWGGVDHVPVHHTNEIAQTEAVTGKPFAKYWMHADFLQLNNEKMAKSSGNIVTVSDLVEKGFSPASIRFFYYLAHYRSQQNFTEQALTQAQESLQRLYDFEDNMNSFTEFSNYNEDLSLSLKAMLSRFEDFLDDDLNTPQALSSIFDFVTIANTALHEKKLSKANVEEIQEVFKSLDVVLGVFEMREKTDAPLEVKALAEEREKARKEKNWTRADELREEIKEKGFLVEDTSQGPRIKPAK